MKLIDMLVEELPKHGGWPYGVRYITQDNGYDTYKGTICGYDSLPEFSRKIWLSNKPDRHANVVIMRINNIASDYTTAIITREQYEAALAAKNEGWIEWDGGECPVADFLKVEYHLRGGAKGSESAKILEWQHEGGRHDIIAYRLHQPQEAGKDKADDEEDMNDCIEQDAAPVWNGEGLPPVGCECKVDYGSVELIDGLSRPDDGDVVRVVSHEKTGFGTQVVVVYWNGVNGVGRAHALIPKCLRPLRTEAERNRDAAVEQMMKFATIHTTKSLGLDLALRSCYDAIAAGKIPGVKLED